MARTFWRTPLAPPPVRPVGEIHVIAERCKGCGFCVEFCPRDVLREATAFNRRGYHPPEVVKQGVCAECHFCELLCPEFAIFITKPEEGDGKAKEGDGKAEIPEEGIHV